MDDRGYVALVKLYLACTSYTCGPMFRVSINGTGGPLSYDAAHHRRNNLCQQPDVEIDIHQLRHAHATGLINTGVFLEAACRRRNPRGADLGQNQRPPRSNNVPDASERRVTPASAIKAH